MANSANGWRMHIPDSSSLDLHSMLPPVSWGEQNKKIWGGLGHRAGQARSRRGRSFVATHVKILYSGNP